MSYISDEVSDAVSALGITARRLSADEADLIRDRLHDRFGLDSQHFSVYLSHESESLHDPKAWSWLSQFVGGSEAILLFPKCNEPEGWEFPDGGTIVRVLEECSGFVFFVTTKNNDCLIAFDDHDCLIGAGTAAEWVRTLRSSATQE